MISAAFTLGSLMDFTRKRTLETSSFAFKSILKRGLLEKEKNCSHWEQTLSF